MKLLVLALASSAAAVDYLATFDGAAGTTFDWLETNDPVMGGKSRATFVVGDGSAVFNGTCAIVDSLAAPGFCSAATERKLVASFADVSAHINGSLQLKVRSTTPAYEGFKVAFRAWETNFFVAERGRRADRAPRRSCRASQGTLNMRYGYSTLLYSRPHAT